MLDIRRVESIFRELLRSVSNDSRLAAFVPAATAILQQAEALARGELDIAPIESRVDVPIRERLPIIATEDLAVTIREAFDKLPGHGDDDDEELAAAYRRVLRNAAVSMLFAVYEQYPHVVPKTRAV